MIRDGQLAFFSMQALEKTLTQAKFEKNERHDFRNPKRLVTPIFWTP